MERLRLQDALRVIGLGLEASRVPYAVLRLDAAGVVVDARGAYRNQTFRWEDLASQAKSLQARRRARRQTLVSMDPWALTRWSVLLRGAGALLDLEGHGTCEIHAAVESTALERESQLRAYVDGQEMLGVEAVRENLLRLRLRREGAQPPQGNATSRPSWPRWAFWRT
jgi:hypothetical protein